MRIARSREGMGVLALLYLAYLLSFADRVIFGQAIKPIKAALGLSDTQIGLLTGFAFAASYALFSPLGGWLIDRNPRKVILVVAVTAWSAATFGTAFAVTFTSMAVMRSAVGVGESLLHPLAVSLIGDTVDRDQRPRAFSLYISAGAVGSIVALLGGGLLVKNLNRAEGVNNSLLGSIAPWQGLFVGAAIPGMLLAIIVMIVMREPARITDIPPKTAPNEGGIAFLRANPRFAAALFLGVSTAQMGAYTLTIWNIPLFERLYGWTGSQTAIALALTSGVMTLFGCLAAGRLIALLRRRGYSDAPLLLAVAASVLFPLFAIIALLMPTPGLTLAVLPLASFWGYVPSVAGFSALGEAVPSPVRARLAGAHTLANGLISNSLGPFMVGALSDRLFHFGGGIRWSLIVVLLVSGLVGTALLAQGRSGYRALMVRA